MAYKLALVINLTAVCLFGYSMYYMNQPTFVKGMLEASPRPLHIYGRFQFLTVQCLLIQLVNAILHVGAHFLHFLEKPRDIIFTTLAYPVGNLVMCVFWGVWYIVGREYIFPVVLSQFYPDWLNHTVHTIVGPLNILMAILVYHGHSKNGVIVTLFYGGIYTAFLEYIKLQTGISVYKYLDTMNDLTRMVYFAINIPCAYLMYKSGEYLTTLVHERPVLEKPEQAGNRVSLIN